MARYRVMHRYASSTFGPWVEGDHVELDAEEAEWVNHDSDGTLKLVDPQEQARQKREAQEAKERTRVAEKEEKEEKEEETPPPAPPAKTPARRGRPPGSGTKRSAT